MGTKSMGWERNLSTNGGNTRRTPATWPRPSSDSRRPEKPGGRAPQFRDGREEIQPCFQPLGLVFQRKVLVGRAAQQRPLPPVVGAVAEGHAFVRGLEPVLPGFVGFGRKHPFRDGP